MKILIVRGIGGFGDISMMSRPMLVSESLGNQVGIVIEDKWRSIFDDWNSLLVINEDNAPTEWRRINLSKPCPAGFYEGRQVDLTRNKDGSAEVRRSRIDVFAEAIGQSIDNHPMIPYIALSHERIIQARKRVDQKKPNIYIQQYSAESYRDWPFFKNLATSLAKKGYKVFVQGEMVDGCENVSGHILDSVALIKSCDLVVAPDSFALHAAASVGTPSVGVFGPISAETRADSYPYASTISVNVPCMPCWRNQRMLCSKSGGFDSWCMSHLYVEYVYRHCVDRLRSISNGSKSPSSDKHLKIFGT